MRPATTYTLHAIAAAVVLCSLVACEDPDPPQPAVTINGMTWEVEVADTPTLRYRGLSFRRVIPDGTGMLFVYPEQQDRLEFCMRDCEVDIDIAFINAAGRVVKVTTMRVEPDRSGSVPYYSDAPAQYALEVRAGALKEAGVKPGDTVTITGIEKK